MSSNFLSEKIEVLRTSVFLNSKCLTLLYVLIIPNLQRNKEMKCTDGDFKSFDTAENDTNLLHLAVKKSFHVPCMK